MSASDEWTEWHLTPKGWVRGSERVDGGGTTEREPPRDRVLTVTYRELMTSGAGPLRKSSHEDWRSEDSALVKQLLSKHGNAPERL